MAAEGAAGPGRLVTRAHAKVNLTLHVEGRRPDGWHELASLVGFAGVSDTLALAPGPGLSLQVSGPRAAGAGPDGENLVVKAARALAERRKGLVLGDFVLTKRLPAAAGIGGGSADAAAALRLLAQANGLSLEDEAVLAAAGATGADVPVCLESRARMMRGVGDLLGPALALPPLFSVLVNPGVAVETAAVFRAMGLKAGEPSGYGAHSGVASGMAAGDLLAVLRRGRNDMEAAACTLAPIIGDVLAVLGAARGCRLARMSGSGATCFGLFETCRAAAKAAKAIAAQHPGWWVKATALR
ncbi:MAG: 4-(cytidine 5'-diphospho)-2-C-methyl-D-erythritol kinase [Alsobacter sp.]